VQERGGKSGEVQVKARVAAEIRRLDHSLVSHVFHFDQPVIKSTEGKGGKSGGGKAGGVEMKSRDWGGRGEGEVAKMLREWRAPNQRWHMRHGLLRAHRYTHTHTHTHA